ncbi:MAG TPA: triose-phosphate isomerase [Clostridia bacterium]|nr:triose-phosphate isomerase [Clostridia bacterium]
MKGIWLGTNWKMHKSLEEGIAYSKSLIELTKDVNKNITFFIIPPYTSLWPIKDVLGDSGIKLGAQSSHWEDQGAYTGEISPMMLAEIGIDIVELGHSERRQYYNENDADINKKAHAVLKYGMKPLICVGENIAQKSYGIAQETIESQMKVCLSGISTENAANVMIAYEPVWAIGENGIPADAEHVSFIHDTIRNVLKDKYGAIGDEIPILYGGSVNEKNSMEYLMLPNVNGLFIGRAAWDLTRFRKIISDADKNTTSARHF